MERKAKGLENDNLPTLRRGDQSNAVTLLQQQLATAGFALNLTSHGHFDISTAVAVADFQASRGLSVDGICGPHTWTALQEAGWTLGDRNLMNTKPMLRGDDVAELQLRLGSLGFDAGRVDGIFGPNTASALQEFQLNSGLTANAICTKNTVISLKRISARVSPTTVAVVRERVKLQRTPHKLTNKHIMVVFSKTLAAVAGELCSSLRRAEAVVNEMCDLSELESADQANILKVDVCLDLRIADTKECRIAYFATEGFVSPGGQRLADILEQRLSATLGFEGTGVQGMRLPILRHTRMTAVQCLIGPFGLIQARLSPVARAIEGSLALWTTKPT
ncbi:MAG: peptidoglycan-binding protein [Acidimicrobiia bacterium]|nr:peptidoglycan-binding protein [Acidimicrobiia bacterium]